MFDADTSVVLISSEKGALPWYLYQANVVPKYNVGQIPNGGMRNLESTI